MLKTSDWQARRDSNPQHPVLETGTLPVELLACVNGLLALLVRLVRTAEAAVLLDLELLGLLLLVPRRVVVPTLALAARERHDIAHGLLLPGRVVRVPHPSRVHKTAAGRHRSNARHIRTGDATTVTPPCPSPARGRHPSPGHRPRGGASRCAPTRGFR